MPTTLVQQVDTLKLFADQGEDYDDDQITLTANSTNNLHVDLTHVAGSLTSGVTSSFTLIGFERIVFEVGEGADTVTINDLSSTTVEDIDVDMGQGEQLEVAPIKTEYAVEDTENGTVEFRQRARVFLTTDPKTSRQQTLTDFLRQKGELGVQYEYDTNGMPVLDTVQVNGQSRQVHRAIPGEYMSTLSSPTQDDLDDLDAQTVPAHLAAEFETNDITLTPQATVQVLTAGSQWLIRDADRTFVVIEEGGDLELYERLFQFAEEDFLFTASNATLNNSQSGPPTVSTNLESEFTSNGITLTPNAEVEVITTNAKWRLTDAGRTFILEADGNSLDVYESIFGFSAGGDGRPVYEEVETREEGRSKRTSETVTENIGGKSITYTEERITPEFGTDSQRDTLILVGSSGDDDFFVSTTTGEDSAAPESSAAADSILVEQLNGLSFRVLNSSADFDTVQIDTRAGDDVLDAEEVVEHLATLHFIAGADDDVLVGSPFSDLLDSGLGDDTVTGGVGVDQFADAGGYDTLIERRDAEFELSDIQLTITPANPSYGTTIADSFTQDPTPEVENIAGPALNGTGSGIFEDIYLYAFDDERGLEGSASDNTMRIVDFTRRAFLDAGPGDDFYEMVLSGGSNASFNSTVYLQDSGTAGIDRVEIKGTAVDDTFYFQSRMVERLSTVDSSLSDQFGTIDLSDLGAITGEPSVRTFSDPSLNRQTVVYGEGIVEDVKVLGGAGDDLFILDDTSTEMEVLGEADDDRFFVGNVTQVKQVPHPDLNPNNDPNGIMISVVDPDGPNGGITNGVSFPATLRGGNGDDYFEVNHNIAELDLYGDNGDDIFYLQAHLTTEPAQAERDENDELAQQEDINVFSEEGQSDALVYVTNAPVNIYGGAGFDTLVIVGTVLGDTFNIFVEEVDDGNGGTKEVQRIYGAGLVVPVIEGIERLLILSAAGDDTINVYGTLGGEEAQEIQIVTGSGNDTVNLGGPEISFDVIIPESKYTKIEEVPRPDLVIPQPPIVVPARIEYRVAYVTDTFLGIPIKTYPIYFPVYRPQYEKPVPPKIVPQDPLLIPRVVTVPEYILPVLMPETRQLVGLQGPVIVDGVETGFPTGENAILPGTEGDDRLVIDNRYGNPSEPGALIKKTVEEVLINTEGSNAAAALTVLTNSLTASTVSGTEAIAADQIYQAIIDSIRDRHRVRDPGLARTMLNNPTEETSVTLRAGERIQAFDNSSTAVSDFLAFTAGLGVSASATATYTTTTIDGLSEVESQVPFTLNATNLDDLYTEFPSGVFRFSSGDLQLDGEVIPDLDGNIIAINVYSVKSIEFDLQNSFVQAIDVDDTTEYDTVSGFGSAYGVYYQNMTKVDLTLSNANETLDVIDAPGTSDKPAVTNIFAGGGDDEINIERIGGETNVFGDVADLQLAATYGVEAYSEDFRVHSGSTLPAHLTSGNNARLLGQLLDVDSGATGAFVEDAQGVLYRASELTTDELVGKTPVADVFDHDNVAHVRLLAAELLSRDPNIDLRDREGATIDGSADSDIFDVISFDTDRYHAQIWVLLQNNRNGLLGESGDYRDLFESAALPNFGTDFAKLIANEGGGVYDPSRYELSDPSNPETTEVSTLVGNLKALGGAVNAQSYQATVYIETAATIEQINESLNTFSSQLWQALQELDSSLPSSGDYTASTYSSQIGALVGATNGFDATNLAHVQALATLLNNAKLQAPVVIDISDESDGDLATLNRLSTALDFTFQPFVWRMLKDNLKDSSDDLYNPYVDPEPSGNPYRNHLTDINTLLRELATNPPGGKTPLSYPFLSNVLTQLSGSFNPDNPLHVKALAVALNDELPQLQIDVDAIRLYPNLDVNQYRGEVWQLLLANNVVSMPTGDDTFYVADANRTSADVTANGARTLEDILANLTVDGQSSVATTGNQLFISERNDTADHGPVDQNTDTSGLLTSSQLTGLGMAGAITYANVELIDITLGSGADVFSIQSTGATTSLKTRAGQDTVNVGSLAPATGGNVDAIAHLVTIDGGANSDVLNVDDQENQTTNVGLLTSSRLTGLGMGNDNPDLGLDYSRMETLNVGLGAGDDTFYIQSTHAGATTVNTGSGADAVQVSSEAGNLKPEDGTLNQIGGSLDVDGGSDAPDILTVYDSGDGTQNTGELSATKISGLGMAGDLAYLDFDSLNLHLASGDDDFFIDSTHEGVTNLYTGDDADTSAGGVPGFVAGSMVEINATSFATDDRSDSTHTSPDTSHRWYSVPNETAGVGAFRGATHGYLQALRVDNGADSNLVEPNPENGYVDFPITITQEQEGDYNLDVLVAGFTSDDDDSPSDTLWVQVLGADELADTENLILGNQTSLMVETSQNGEFTWKNAGIWTLKQGTHTIRISMRESGVAISALRFGLYEPEPVDDTININGISGLTNVHAGAGNDALNVNYDAAGNQTFLNNINAVLNLHGETGSDRYQVGLAGYGSSLINVIDDPFNVGDSENTQDTLVIYGTDEADQFLLRSRMIASYERDLDGNETGIIERVNYDGNINGGLIVNGRSGDDYFVLDDNSVITTINGDLGDDRFQVGQVFESPRDANAGLAVEDWFETTLTSRGYLSNGTSLPATINGGGGNDDFTVYSNKAVLSLNGDEDDDTFTIRAFVEVDPAQAKDRISNVNGGSGADLVAHTVDAPVNIDGGDGFDTVVILGTEFGEEFVVTDQGVFGAGKFLQIRGVEEIEIDGGEGNDSFYVLSTSADVNTTVIGGLGSDTFEIAGGRPDGSPLAVTSNDLRGHSGLIRHTVISDDADFDGLPVDEVSAEVADNDEVGIVITPSAGVTRIFEPNDNGDLLGASYSVTDSYTVVLTKEPEEDVRVTVVPEAPSESAQASGARGVNVYLADDDPPGDALTLLFSKNNWFIPQTVFIEALADSVSEGTEYYTINHSVIEGISPDDEGAYDGIPVREITVEVTDTDGPGVVVRQLNGGNEEDKLTRVAEVGGFETEDRYELLLTSQPSHPVTVSLSFDTSQLNAALEGAATSTTSVTFTPEDWDTPRVVRVTAIHDNLPEGNHFSRIRHTVASSDATYDGLVVSAVDVQIRDGDAAGVQIIPTNGTTQVVEATEIEVLTATATVDNQTTLTGSFVKRLHDSLDLTTFRVTEITLLDENQNVIPTTVADAEPNDTIATAQNIDSAFWSLNANDNIGDRIQNTSTTIPHVTIEGTGNGTFDYYSFTASAGAVGTFDIDFGKGGNGSFDTYLRLYRADGTLLASNDDSLSISDGQGGSISRVDSFLQYTFPTDGAYVVQVSRYPGFYPVPAGGDYQLQISLTNHPLLVDLSYNANNGTLTFAGTTSNVASVVVSYEVCDVNGGCLANETTFDNSGGDQTLDVNAADNPAIDLTGLIVEYDDGQGQIQRRTITGWSETAIQIDSAWSPKPGVNASYRVISNLGIEPISDGYEVVLTRVPTKPVQVRVQPLATPTYDADLRFVEPNYGQLNNIQVDVSDANESTTDSKLGYITLEFDSSNWNVPQYVQVRAVDDSEIDGSDFQVFGQRADQVNVLRGPLTIEGGLGDNPDRSLNDPLLLPGETNLKAPDSRITTATSDTLTDETTVFDDVVGYEVTILSGVGQGQVRTVTAVSGDRRTLTVSPPWEKIPNPKDAYSYAPVNANLNVNEATQVDILNVRNGDSPAVDTAILTDSTLTGLGMATDVVIGGRPFAGGITYNDLEVLTLDLGGNTDQLTIESTHRGATVINTGAGSDTIDVRTLAGHTTLNTGAGDDTVNVGTIAGRVDEIGALLVINGESDTMSSNASIGDVVNINDSGDDHENVGVLTPTTLTGLDMPSVGEIQSIEVRADFGTLQLSAIDLEDETHQISVAGFASASADPLAAALDANRQDLEAALVSVYGTGVTVTRSGDDFLVTFGGELAGMDIEPLTWDSAAEPGLEILEDNPRQITLDVSISTIRDGSSDPLRNTVQTLTLPAGLANFELVVADPSGPETNPAISVAVTDATLSSLQSALDEALNPNNGDNSLPFTRNFELVQLGNDFLIRFQGAYRGFTVAPIQVLDSTGASVSTATVATRIDGINYYGIEQLNIDLGSDDDVFNVQGTSAETNLNLHDGDDKIFVSSTANEEVGSTLRFLNGHLNEVSGDLNIDGGDGRHLLLISDHDAVEGDARVTIAEDATNADAIRVQGLATGDIKYQVDATANFADGIRMWTGSGNDQITISATHYRAGIRTTTLLSTGHGDDTVTVDLDVADSTVSPAVRQDGFFVLNTQGPDDSVPVSDQDRVLGADSTLPLIVFGGSDQDEIQGGSADDILFGDRGRVEYSDDSDNIVMTLGQGGNQDFFDSRILTPSKIFTIHPTIGDDDVVQANGGDDIVLGGTAGDTIRGGAGNDLVFGDHGLLEGEVDANYLPLATDSPAFIFTAIDVDAVGSADDTIYGDAGEDILLGQQGDDIIYGGTDDDDLIGGHNVAGGYDGNDRLDGGGDNDVIAGDNAIIERKPRTDPVSGTPTNPRMRALEGTRIYGEVPNLNDGDPLITPFGQVNPTGVAERHIVLLDQSNGADTAMYGNDYIAGGAADDMLFGQLGDDTIQGDGSIDEAVSATRDESGLTVDASVDAETDGDDYIEGNGGNDVIFGNLGQDDIVGGSSSLFVGLETSAQRPDGSDLIFGGAGTAYARNDEGDLSADGHARDADMILGDNGNIYRLVGTYGTSSDVFLTFNYDNNLSGLRIIPRAAELIDYTPGGTAYNADASDDIGGDDEIHGEAGDDFIYGMTGNDSLFGDGQNDDLIGGVGSDFISGGQHTDGVLGDDGRIYTSRNKELEGARDEGLSEPLYGIAKVDEVGELIDTPGGFFEATIHVAGALKKTVNLTPFSLDPSDPLADAPQGNHNYDDLVFGGLGDDFLHGGPGSDGLSGTEALAEYYDFPANLGGVLGFGKDPDRPEEFAAYDEYDPLRRIQVDADGFFSDADGQEFILNFNTVEIVDGNALQDGNDSVFGDLGNDILFGGPGRDHLYGGHGLDLLNADDDLDTSGGLNDGPDTAPNNADIAVGGAGRDILIANTVNDRLVDWKGEFNSYIVPFSPFGHPTISRGLPPHLTEFLYQLSAADGVDPTRFADTGQGADRNGEPVGEVGIYIQSDQGWFDQSGAPDDVQPGNLAGGSRDTLQQASFDDGQAQGFAPDTGVWKVQGGRFEVGPTEVGQDAVSVYFVERTLPNYFELLATINADKDKAGLKSNAYLIFDYQDPLDFKFAGVNPAIDKLQIGHRTADGWIVDVQSNLQLRDNTDYNLTLAINGVTATLVVDNQHFLSHAFTPRTDAYGITYGLNAGMIGIGAENSRGRIDNVRVQVLPPELTLDALDDLGSVPSLLLREPPTGNWQTTDGRYLGSPSDGNSVAVAPIDLRIAPQSVLRLEALLAADGEGGFIFDRKGMDDFKFVTVSSLTNQVIIGHYTSRHGWEIDKTVTRTIDASVDQKLLVSLRGTTVDVSLNDQSVLGYVYNGVTVDGGFGLLSRTGAVSFDEVRVQTDDPDYLVWSQPVAARTAEVLDKGVASKPATAVLDANRDGFISPIDALLVINYLNDGSESLAGLSGAVSPADLDINRDGFVTPIDALLVINNLNQPADAVSPLPEGQIAAALKDSAADQTERGSEGNLEVADSGPAQLAARRYLVLADAKAQHDLLSRAFEDDYLSDELESALDSIAGDLDFAADDGPWLDEWNTDDRSGS